MSDDHDGCNMATSKSESLIEQTVTAAKSGNRSLAELHFRQVMQLQSEAIDDPDLWLMMAWLAPSPLAMSQVLQSFLANHPTNELAQSGLRWSEGIANLGLTPEKVSLAATASSGSVKPAIALDVETAPSPPQLKGVSFAPSAKCGPADFEEPVASNSPDFLNLGHPRQSVSSIELDEPSTLPEGPEANPSAQDQYPSFSAFGFVPLEDAFPDTDDDRLLESAASSAERTASSGRERPETGPHLESGFAAIQLPSSSDTDSLGPLDELASLPETVEVDAKPYVIDETSELNQDECSRAELHEIPSVTTGAAQDPAEYPTAEVGDRASAQPIATQLPIQTATSVATTIDMSLSVETESWGARAAAEDIQILQSVVEQELSDAVHGNQQMESDNSSDPEHLLRMSRSAVPEPLQERGVNHKPTGPSILVVDDSPTVRKLLTVMLSQSGYDVLTAFDGVDAIRSIATHLPQLIITDINMPRLDGYKLCKLVTRDAQTKHIPVIMLSGGIIDRLRGKLAGCAGYLEKPITPASLTAVVEFALQESSLRT